MIVLPIFLLGVTLVEDPIQDYQDSRSHIMDVKGYVYHIYRLNADINSDGQQDCLLSDNLKYFPDDYWNEEHPEDKEYVWETYVSAGDKYYKCTNLVDFPFSQLFTGDVPGWNSTKLFGRSYDRNKIHLIAIFFDGKYVNHETVRTFDTWVSHGEPWENDIFWKKFLKENHAAITIIPVTPYWVGEEEEDEHAAINDGEVSGTSDVTPPTAETHAPPAAPHKEQERVIPESRSMTSGPPGLIAKPADIISKTSEKTAPAKPECKD